MNTRPPGQIKPWLSHHLAHGIACDLATLALWLAADKAMGYTGMTIVPILWEGSAEMTPEAVARVFEEAGMIMQVCGFLPGDRFSMQDGEGRHRAIAALASQLRFVKAAVALGVGPNHLVGPVDIAWMGHKQTGDKKQGWTIKNYRLWLRRLQKFAADNDTEIAIEFLNRAESPNPDPFCNLVGELQGNDKLTRLFIHWDTGHAAMLQLLPKDFTGTMSSILYFEAANWGRHPLAAEVADKPRIQFSVMYFHHFENMPHDCVYGVEPFDYQTVITEFGLQELCTTTLSGSECLRMDAKYLSEDEGVMELGLAS